MKKLYILFITTAFLSCETQTTEVKESAPEKFKTVYVTIGELTDSSVDKTYGNFVIPVKEIDKTVMENGTVIAYLERAAKEDRPQRWSMFPQYCLNCENSYGTKPSFIYFSYGEGLIRISLRSQTDISDAAEWISGKKIKLTIID
jgi:hypothetical protein